MFAMVLLTMLVGVIALRCRIRAIRTGEMTKEFLILMQGVDVPVPESVIKTTRCFINLFEVPVLFYIVAVLVITQDAQSAYFVLLAFGFVLSRVAQAWIHITYNHVPHRMIAFGISVICVLSLWTLLLLSTP
ncbi:MAPEG family protein [Parasalinivibrio latis]|uniref:MAPEG family protein n=1 Tax=Parasalinivibrio latis TaxID=2952610 RepID=UPI003DA2093D